MAKKAQRTGRPQAEIDWGKVDSYLRAQCNGTGIAAMLGIHPDTLYKACERDHKMTFTAYSQIKKAAGQELLKAAMYQSALYGDRVMQIWLSKQYLGMTDKTDVTTAGSELKITPISFKAQNGDDE